MIELKYIDRECCLYPINRPLAPLLPPSTYNYSEMSYPPYPSGSTEEVTAVEEYVIGPENIPFFTTKVSRL